MRFPAPGLIGSGAESTPVLQLVAPCLDKASYFRYHTLTLMEILKSLLKMKVVVYLLFGLLGLGMGYLIFGNDKVNSAKTVLKPAKATQEVNQEYSFPLKNSAGEEVSQLKYKIEKAEIRDEIIVKGKRASSVKGRTFLVVNISIKNGYNKGIEVETRDYIRLSVNGNKDEWFAPDIHNDPTEVQAQSVKQTRVAFPIDETAKDLILRIGEINGGKQELPLTLK